MGKSLILLQGILLWGILSFPISGTHKIWGILSHKNFSLRDFVMGDFVAGGFCHGGFCHGGFCRRFSLSTLARGKREYVMRLEIRYFFLEIRLSLGLTQSQEKNI